MNKMVCFYNTMFAFIRYIVNSVFAFVVLFFAISMPTKVLWANGRVMVCEKEEYDKTSMFVTIPPTNGTCSVCPACDGESAAKAVFLTENIFIRA